MLSSLAPHESLHALARARLATIHGAPTPFDKPQACAAESRAPFKAAAAIFEAGFASEDVAKGGCPGLPGPGRR